VNAPASVDRAGTMRRTATGLLVLMAGVYLIARHFQGLHPDAHPFWGYVLAFSEAAMVGGLADWFAVTALFRRPLGLPIPHTAIIPANKDRIADTMAAFLRENFLTPAVVARRMRGMNLAAAMGAFLIDSRSGEARLRDGAAGLAGDLLRSLDQKRLGGLVKEGIRLQLPRIEVAPLLGQMIGAAIADRRHLPLLESAIRWAGHTLEENEELVRGLITRRAARIFQLTGFDTRIANAVLDGIYKLLAECAVDPAHPLRRKVEEGLEQLAHDLRHDPAMRQRVERMKLELLADPAVGAWIDGLWERARAALLRATADPERALGGQFGSMLAELGKALERDARLQYLINRFARRTAVGVASRYGGQIVRLVSETVKRWDARTVTDRVEGAVGRDLQFIRINGTMVGGLVGVAIHAVDGWL
jgi:uncharacterized membrane-anchored protein YjiN (DUF445 family)